MTDFLKHTVFKTVSDIAQEMNVSAYVIGGYTRDLLLKRNSKDIDIVVTGNGIEMAEKVALALGQNAKVNIFKTFGTAMIHHHDCDIEFVGARKESYKHSSRKPDVVPGTLEEDINRRDFTINSMAISLNKIDFGTLLDPFNGIQDLQDKIIRTPLNPAITFSDDPLRMLRAIRFASQLYFKIEPVTFQAIKANCKRIEIISKERIIDELNKIILSPIPSVGFEMLDDCGLLEIVFPQLTALKGVETIGGQAHKDNFYHTLEVLDNLSVKTDNLWLRWAAILHDIAKPITKKYDHKEGWTFHGHEYIGYRMVKQIFQSLKLPLNDKMKYVEKLVLLHLRPIPLSEESVSDSAIRRLLFDAGDDINDLMMLAEADITSKNTVKVKKYLTRFSQVRQRLEEIEEKDRIRNWQPPVSGKEIMKVFHLAPCREVGIIKNAIRNAILDGIIPNDYDSVFQFMLEEGKKMNLKPCL